ncbi:MAG: hypothetical protein JEZ00_06140 [Anaerolineaceae bacterium]|nr:hypothetical protein [Anaerolineaceae bacterium]
MKKRILFLINTLLIFSLACSVSALPWTTEQTPTSLQPTDEPVQPVVLFTIGVHVEPFGVQKSELVGEESPAVNTSTQLNYHNRPLYERHAENLSVLAAMVESHAGRMTIQVQSPFTTLSSQWGNSVLAELAANGHEMALHFHEEPHLGKMANELDALTWCNVMQEEMLWISQASTVDVSEIRYWSGGNLYPHLLEAAACAGLDINSDWKNPQTQTTDLALVGVNPWRPAGNSLGADVTLFAQHDVNGQVIFLPEGNYDRENFAGKSRTIEMGGEEAYFDYLESALLDSLAVASVDKVNVFHFTVHAGEFVGDPDQPYELLNRWLTEVIDPLVTSGQVRWATFAEMADAFVDWEAAHPDEDARAQRIAIEVYAASIDEIRKRG